jgi:hypothetical protein
MASWDAEKTRKLVRTLYGLAQLGIVREYINSAIYRQRYIRFHIKEIKAILGAYTGIHLKSEYIANSILIENTKEQNDFEYCQTRIGAHVIAAVQSIHSLADILVSMAYYSLGCNLLLSSRKENQYLLEAKQTFFSKNIKHSKIEVILDSIFEHKEFKYLTALANHSINHNLIKATLWFAATGKPQNLYTLKFQAFIFDKNNYENRLVLPFLENEYNRLSKITAEIGSTLNSTLAIK